MKASKTAAHRNAARRIARRRAALELLVAPARVELALHDGRIFEANVYPTADGFDFETAHIARRPLVAGFDGYAFDNFGGPGSLVDEVLVFGDAAPFGPAPEPIVVPDGPAPASLAELIATLQAANA